jgi:polysaccharide deacetylase 2 family uncharacterized protein YibQ
MTPKKTGSESTDKEPSKTVKRTRSPRRASAKNDPKTNSKINPKKKRSPATRKKSLHTRKKSTALKYRYDTKSVIALLFSVLSFIVLLATLIYVVLDEKEHQEIRVEEKKTPETKTSQKPKKDFFEENYDFLFEEKNNQEHEKIFVPSKQIVKKDTEEITQSKKNKKETRSKVSINDEKDLYTQNIQDPAGEVIQNVHSQNKNIPREHTVQTVQKETSVFSAPDSLGGIKPKLAIIIDDISFGRHLDFLQLGMNINLSFLPPTKNHPDSADITTPLSNYLIHLPMQSRSRGFKEEEGTLHIYDDFETIDARVAYLKKLYPNAKVINNHTGSLFTQDNRAMDMLMRSLKKHGFYFIDSRTTAKSVAKQFADKHKVPMLSRNVFLDNKRDINYIKNNLRKSVKLAKKYHQAIAIGHPYNVTLQAIQELKPYLESEVDIVFVDELNYHHY